MVRTGEGNAHAPFLQLITIRTGAETEAQCAAMTTAQFIGLQNPDTACTLGAWSLQSTQEACPHRDLGLRNKGKHLPK